MNDQILKQTLMLIQMFSFSLSSAWVRTGLHPYYCFCFKSVGMCRLGSIYKLNIHISDSCNQFLMRVIVLKKQTNKQYVLSNLSQQNLTQCVCFSSNGSFCKHQNCKWVLLKLVEVCYDQRAYISVLLPTCCSRWDLVLPKQMYIIKSLVKHNLSKLCLWSFLSPFSLLQKNLDQL